MKYSDKDERELTHGF
ncbi:hypothetical protein VCHC50A1_1261, partial [Vibrio cholerae HC-50A1]